MTPSDKIRKEIDDTMHSLEQNVERLDAVIVDKVAVLAVGVAVVVGVWFTFHRKKKPVRQSSVGRRLAMGALVAAAAELGKSRFPDAEPQLASIQTSVFNKMAGSVGLALLDRL